MITAKGKKMNKNILKKLKPIDLGRKKKQINGTEILKNIGALDKEETVHEINSQEHGFSDNSIWQTKKFDAPVITRSEESTPLERTAEEAPIQNQNESNIKEIATDYSSIQKSESSAYRISSDYEGRTTYDSRDSGQTMRPTMSLGNEQRRTGLTNPFVRPEEVQRSGLEEFSRLEEQRREEREEKQKLPFMQKKREEEIF